MSEQLVEKKPKTKKILVRIIKQLEKLDYEQRLRTINTLNIFFNTTNQQAFSDAKFKKMLQRISYV